MALCASCGQYSEGGSQLCTSCASPERQAYVTAGASSYRAGPARRNAPQVSMPGYLPKAGRVAAPGYITIPGRVPAPDYVPACWPAEPGAAEVTMLDGLAPVATGPAHPEADRTGPPLAARTAAAWSARPSRWWFLLAAGAAALTIAAGAVILATGPHTAAGGKAAAAAQAQAARSAGTRAGASSQLVTVSPAAATSSHAAGAAEFLTHYFTAINRHDFAAYRKLFSTPLRGGLSPATFAAGYGTTREAGIVLGSLRVTGPGQVFAVVSFTSHQDAASSPTRSACTAWRIALYLVKHGHHYVMQSPPHSYRASAARCS
jgi:hypothetical protein